MIGHRTIVAPENVRVDRTRVVVPSQIRSQFLFARPARTLTAPIKSEPTLVSPQAVPRSPGRLMYLPRIQLQFAVQIYASPSWPRRLWLPYQRLSAADGQCCEATGDGI